MNIFRKFFRNFHDFLFSKHTVRHLWAFRRGCRDTICGNGQFAGQREGAFECSQADVGALAGSFFFEKCLFFRFENIFHPTANQFCASGDHTVEALAMAVRELKAETSEFDERFVILLSDANLDRYGIRPSELRRALQLDESVNAFVVLIGSLGEQAAVWVPFYSFLFLCWAGVGFGFRQFKFFHSDFSD